MLVQRRINNTPIATDINKGSSIYLTKADMIKSGINIADCSLKDIERYLKGEREVVPFDLTWELTNHCNLNCEFCYIHNHVISTDITFEEAKPYLDEMIEMGLIRATLTGGECTLHKDFLKIYKYLKEKGVLVDVYTNGIHIKDQVIETFKKYPPNSIEMTMYNTLVSQPTPYTNAIKFKEMGIHVLVKFTVTKTTLPYYNEVKQWCEQNKIPFKCDTDIMDAYDATKTSKYQIEMEDKIAIDKTRVQPKGQKKIEQYEMECFSCGAGNVSYHINSNFELGLCCHDKQRYTIKGKTFQSAYEEMVNKIMKYKHSKYKNCTECYAKPICRMCYLRGTQTTDENGNDIIEAKKDFCKATQEYYKKLFS